MIDKKFWKKIAENWVKDDDGIVLPEDTIDTSSIVDIDPDLASYDEETDDDTVVE